MKPLSVFLLRYVTTKLIEIMHFVTIERNNTL